MHFLRKNSRRRLFIAAYRHRSSFPLSSTDGREEWKEEKTGVRESVEGTHRECSSTASRYRGNKHREASETDAIESSIPAYESVNKMRGGWCPFYGARYN